MVTVKLILTEDEAKAVTHALGNHLCSVPKGTPEYDPLVAVREKIRLKLLVAEKEPVK